MALQLDSPAESIKKSSPKTAAAPQIPLFFFNTDAAVLFILSKTVCVAFAASAVVFSPLFAAS